jgi:hypothetical protein
VEKHHAGERERDWGDADFSGTKERCEAGRLTQLDGDKARSNYSRADSEEGTNAAGQLLDIRLQMKYSGANESALTETK